jgi:hypothetical protein
MSIAGVLHVDALSGFLQLIMLPSKSLQTSSDFCSNFLAACPTGWKERRENCYKKFPSDSWNNAKKACEIHEATLAEPEDEEENNFLKNTFGGNNWLGLSRCHRRSTCRLDVTGALWTNWAPGQPDKRPQYPPGQRNKDFAVVIRGDGKWSDQPKLEKRDYICKKPGKVE